VTVVVLGVTPLNRRLKKSITLEMILPTAFITPSRAWAKPLAGWP
jgi:hypothetical protein